ncbi:MAG: hypothetical protein JWM47_1445 [Acidimicrobiales bacterium]|nr:hypothetical protein [Acidimicrobiales bacterium]
MTAPTEPGSPGVPRAQVRGADLAAVILRGVQR